MCRATQFIHYNCHNTARTQIVQQCGNKYEILLLFQVRVARSLFIYMYDTIAMCTRTSGTRCITTNYTLCCSYLLIQLGAVFRHAIEATAAPHFVCDAAAACTYRMHRGGEPCGGGSVCVANLNRCKLEESIVQRAKRMRVNATKPQSGGSGSAAAAFAADRWGTRLCARRQKIRPQRRR